MSLNTCKKLPSGNIVTAKGKLFYTQYLIEPENGKHNLMIVFKPDTDLSVLKNEMGKLALEGTEGDKKQAMNFVEKRFTDPNNRSNGGKPAGDEYEGWTLVTAATNTTPDFVYPNGQKIPAESLKGECYSGRWARVTLNPYWLDKELVDKDTGKKVKVRGVFIGLQNVQLLDHDTPIGFVKASGSDEFDSVEIEGGSAPSTVAVDDSGSDVDALFG